MTRARAGTEIGYTVVGGFLGSGKTTLINAMLSTATIRLAVIVNDIGDVNIDARLIAAAAEDGPGGAATIELTNGCVCCSIGDSLAATLRDLCLATDGPDHIVLECSGAALPAKAGAYGDRRILAPPSIVVAADATDVRRRADDRRFSGLLRGQLSSADLVVVTKTDLVDDVESVTDWLRATTGADVAVGHPSGLGAILTDLQANRRPAATHRGRPQPPPDPSAPPLRVRTRTFDGPVDVAAIEHWLNGLPDLVRAKGIVTTESGPMLIQWSANRLAVEPWSGLVMSNSVVTIA